MYSKHLTLRRGHAVWATLVAGLMSFPASAQNYSITSVIAPSTVYAGSKVYVQMQGILHSTSIVPLYIESVTFAGVPVSPFEFNCRKDDCQKDPNRSNLYFQRMYPGYISGQEMILRFTIPAETAPGTYNLVVQTFSGITRKVLTLPMKVLAAPAAPPANPWLPSLPIPGLAKWETTMRALGTKWCYPTQKMSFGDESQVWFYDGARVFFEAADYLKDPAFEACALNIARQYRDHIVAANGTPQPWRLFSRGLHMAYERTGDESYLNAMKLAATNAGLVTWQVALDDKTIREVAYALNAVVDAERAGLGASPHRNRLAAYLLTHFDRLFVAKTYSLHQTFFDGLGAEALINYYELTHDPRIPPTIKLMLDWIWNYGWNKSTFKLVYNPDPAGPTCSAGNGCQMYYSELTNLVAPAFAWYWRVTGDTTYQVQGDELFEHALDLYPSWNGKVFSQNYHWSPEYVRWRTTTGSTCSFQVSPTTASVPGTGGTVTVNVSASSCAWTGVSNVSWAVVNGNSSGSGTATVVVAPNISVEPRQAVIKFGTATLQISQAGKSAQGVSTVQLEAAVVVGGRTTTQNQIILGAPAPAGGLVVQLLSSVPASVAVPASVVVPAGATTVPFTLTTSPTGTTRSVTISALGGGASASASITVNPPAVAILTATPTIVKSGRAYSTGSIRLTSPAGPTGVVVNLSSSNATALLLPAQVTIPPNGDYAAFTLTGGLVTTDTVVTINAWSCQKLMTATVTVSPVRISAVQLSPPTAVGGVTTTGNRVVLDSPAPAGGVTVQLKATSATVPATVIVAPGMQTSPFFNIETSNVAAATAAQITASFAGTSVSATLNVTPAELANVTVGTSQVKGGTTLYYGRVNLSGTAPTGGLVVQLSSSDPAVQIPASVTVLAGKTYASFTTTTSVVSALKTITVTAAAQGGVRTTTVTVTP